VVSLFHRRVAGLALVAFLVGLGLPFVGDGHLGFNGDDSACGSDFAFNVGRPLQFAASSAMLPSQHCAICHLQRASSGASPSTAPGPVSAVVAAEVCSPSNICSPSSTTIDRQPARAPPASLLS